jgi:dienelactone hydrolase
MKLPIFRLILLMSFFGVFVAAPRLQAQAPFTFTINNANNTFVYTDAQRTFSGIFIKPAGNGPFPAVIINHGQGGTPSGYSLPKANEMLPWGLVCIGPALTHAGGPNIDTSPEGAGNSPENVARGQACLAALASVGYVDMTRVAVWGHSKGAYATIGQVAAMGAQIRASGISAGGTIPGSVEEGAHAAAPTAGEAQPTVTPFIMFHGTVDGAVSPSFSENFKALLDGKSVPNARHTYDTAGLGADFEHNLHKTAAFNDDMLTKFRAWLTTHGVLSSGLTFASSQGGTELGATTGVAASATLTVSGGMGPYAWTLTGGQVPAGMALGGNGVLSGTPTQSGSFVFTVQAMDANGLSGIQSYTLTVGGVNHRPVLSWIADRRTAPNTAIAPITFMVEDVETPADALTVTAVSSNTVLLPDTGITLNSTGANWTATLTPVGGQTGRVTVTLTVSDGSKTSARSFTLTVANTISNNTPPMLQGIADEAIPMNGSYGPLTLVVKDTESAENTLTLSAASSNPVLVPVGKIAFGGQNYGRTVTVTPETGQTGQATITLTVSDGSNTASTSFMLEVVDQNTPPTVAGLPSYAVTAPAGTPPAIAFTVGDAETAAADLRVTATSSNAELVSSANIVVAGSGENRTVTVTPETGATGAATLTLAVSDGDIIHRAEVLYAVVDPAGPEAQFSRPRGIFVLDGAGPANYLTGFGTMISLRDNGIRDLPFVDGYALRVAWGDVEGGPGQYDFFIIENALNKLPSGQQLSLLLVPKEPAYIAAEVETTEGPGVATWNDNGTLRAVPWNPYLRERRQALFEAMAAHVVDGVPLGRHPRLVMLDPFLPGGHTGLRDPITLKLREMPGYTRQRLLEAAQEELRALQDHFPGKFVQIGFWPILDDEDFAYGNLNAWKWIRDQLLAEFNGVTRPRIGFFMESLAAERLGPALDPYDATPRTDFAGPLFAAREAAWNGFQMLGSWTNPFNDGHVNATLNGTPNDALEFAFRKYGSEYYEVYIGDIDNPVFQPALQRWHDFYAGAATTNPNSDEDGDGLPLAWEQARELDPRLNTGDDGAAGDPGGDGVGNLVEFAANLAPGSGTGLSVVAQEVHSADGATYLTYTYRRRTDAPWLSYTVEVSTDLMAWNSGADFSELAADPAPTGDGVTETVTVRVLPALNSGSDRRFVRLQITGLF